MTPAQQQLLFENTARAMGDAKLHIKQRHVANCTRPDPAYAAHIRLRTIASLDAVQSCLDRIAEVNPHLNAIVHMVANNALRPKCSRS